MEKIFTFHETVRGYFHAVNGFPCEDSSASFSAENGKYHIAIVADGHGSKSCFRSNIGSRVATEVAMEVLRQFADEILASENTENKFYEDAFSDFHYQHTMVRSITNAILAKWYDRVLGNYKMEPPSLEEKNEYAYECENEQNIAHIYGTTLIAALQIPGGMILLQQGDGRCEVFYEDGTVDQPIPWDWRCENTTTTSLCDEDAAECFRSCVINLREKPIIACYLGCDGIEDAYRDTYEGLGNSHILMGGVHTFYKYLTCQMSQVDFNSWLPDFLENFSTNGIFSRSGSGDDISVAGIVDLDKALHESEHYAYDVKLYELEEKLFWHEDALRGKTRKHAILQKRFNEVQTEYDHARSEYQDLQKSLVQMQLQKKKEQIEFSKIENKYIRIRKNLLKVDEDIKIKEEKLHNLLNCIQEYEIKRNEACAIYEEYDSKYREIETERNKLIQEISALQKENN